MQTFMPLINLETFEFLSRRYCDALFDTIWPPRDQIYKVKQPTV